MSSRNWLIENRLVIEKKDKPFVEVLRLVNRWTHKIMLIIAQISLIAMVIIVTMTVILRYCFATGIGWAEEVPRLIVVLFTFLACSMGVRDHMHVSVNIIYNLFKPNGKVRKFFEVFADVCILICGFVLMYYGNQYVRKLMRLGSGILPMTGWPTWIQYIPAPMAGFVMTFDSLLFLTGVLKADDLLYSEKEIDYMDEMLHHNQLNHEGGDK